MLDLDMERTAATPKDAATIVLVRDGEGPEVFCVERSRQSRFMGGAIVFPGGKLDPADSDPAWAMLASEPRQAGRTNAEPFTKDEAHLRALAVAACRETLEEAGMLPLIGDATQDELFDLRRRMTSDPSALRSFLEARGASLDLGALYPFARWITPIAEARRFDARFFIAIVPAGQTGAHDEHETVSSFWSSPKDVLRRESAGEVTLMPPTHRTMLLLAGCANVADVIALASSTSLDPICPRLVRQRDGDGQTMALVLPGDPEHDVREARVAGSSRYVLRGERWQAEDAP